jgi:NTP pyrophosphatase (non-canonical NTP hydrolase)
MTANHEEGPMTDATSADKTLRELQQEVDDWVQDFGGGYWSPLANIARIAEEVGEAARLVMHLHGPKPKKPGEEAQEPGEELCDIIYAIICLANSQGVDLQESFEKVMEKYRSRDRYRYVEPLS